MGWNSKFDWRGRGDECLGNVRAGCFELLRTVQSRVRPRLHVFGYIDEDAGCLFDGKTLYVNTSNCSIRYRTKQHCTVIDIPHNTNEPAKVVLPQCSLNEKEVILWLKVQRLQEDPPIFCTHGSVGRWRRFFSRWLGHWWNRLRFENESQSKRWHLYRIEYSTGSSSE